MSEDSSLGIDDLSMHRLGLEDSQSDLPPVSRYSKLRIIAELRHKDCFHSSKTVSCIEFGRDDEFFATCGLSGRIKVFEFATVMNDLAVVHSPVVELSAPSKLSCLSWNKHTKSQIVTSDYGSSVTVWDLSTAQNIMEYQEHQKRVWSVDFSQKEPTRLVSGSDDGYVKVWCTRQETSVISIDTKANVCCVKYNPASGNHVAVGSADHHIYYYDIRKPLSPFSVFIGHQKAVSYVKFISPNELASASTDSTLRLWDVQENTSIRIFEGHKNKKNFAGFSVNSEYIASGSETNEVYVYHKSMSTPVAFQQLASPGSHHDAPYFISAVCWKSETTTMLAANCEGSIKVLELAP